MTRRSTDLLPPVQSPTAFADEKKEEEGGALPHLDSKGTITVEGEVRSLKRDLNSRQITMISIAGTIGTGLFLGTGSALATGGPGSMVLSYSVIGGLVFVLMHCITEFVTQLPVAGGYPTWYHRFIDEPTAFALGWASILSHACTVAGDLTTTQLLLRWWTNHLVWLASLCFILFVSATNLLGVKYYGELTYALSLLKIIAVVIFIILGIIVNAGANTTHTYIGAQYWTIGDAPFVNGFAGFAALFVKAAYAFSGVETCGLAAAETKNPSRNVRKIANRTFFRILFFYIVTVILIAFNVPYNMKNLSTSSAATSPFTIVFQLAGANGAGSFMNAVVITSVVSASSEASYTGSRILHGMAIRGHAPKVFGRLSTRGVPHIALLTMTAASLVFFGISFAPGGAGQIWTWTQALVGINSLFSWTAIGLSSWRFRAAWKAQGKPVTSLKAPSLFGDWGAPIVVCSFGFILLIQGWKSFKGGFDPVAFVKAYVEFPVVFILYWGFRLIKKSKTPSLLEIDLVTGTYDDSAADEEDNEKIERREHGRLGWAWKVWGWVA